MERHTTFKIVNILSDHSQKSNTNLYLNWKFMKILVSPHSQQISDDTSFK